MKWLVRLLRRRPTVVQRIRWYTNKSLVANATRSRATHSELRRAA